MTENEAALIARNFLKTSNVIKTPKSKPIQVSLAHEFKSADATLIYAFNNRLDGFVLVSGDDAVTPILGYSDSGSFDYNSLPDHLLYIKKQPLGH